MDINSLESKSEIKMNTEDNQQVIPASFNLEQVKLLKKIINKIK